MSWFDKIQQAEFGGVKFGVLTGTGVFGRRNVVHEYPQRDTIWPEDLGRAPRRIRLTGFLIENSLAYGGGDVFAQRDRLVAAAETRGIAKLIHPTLGELDVSLIEVEVTESWDHGRVFQLNFTFIDAGQKVFPTVTVATVEAVFIAAAKADLAAAQDFVAGMEDHLNAGGALVRDAVSTSVGWLQLGQRAVNDASSLYNLVADLPGQFGRFFGIALKGIAKSTAAAVSAPLTLPDMIARGASNRLAYQQAAEDLEEAAGVLSSAPREFCDAAQHVALTILATSIDPATALRILRKLAAFTTTLLPGTAPVSASLNALRTTAESMFRRASIACAARAVAGYQPSSYDDAVAVRTFVCDLLEDEAVKAADEGDISYMTLLEVRTAVSRDMTERGANLGINVLVETPMPMPALVLAQRLYRDASRADELIQEANVIHPAFMPTSFYALNR